jgi:acid phosphatase
MKQTMIYAAFIAVVSLAVAWWWRSAQTPEAPPQETSAEGEAEVLSEPIDAILEEIPPVEEVAESGPVREYLLLGDTGSGDAAQYAVAAGMASYCADAPCAAAFILGDVIYDNGVQSVDDPQFATKFEDPYAAVDLPFYIAFGNHDYRGCTQCYLDYAGVSHKWQMPARYYRHTIGEVDFYVIDTERFDADQQAWLGEMLAVETDHFRVVVGHRPIVTYETGYADTTWSGQAALTERLCQTADVYAAGHAHILEDIGPIGACRVQQIVSGGGGAALRTRIADAPDSYALEDHGFVVLRESTAGLSAAFVDTEGNVLHERRLVAR